jgi:ATP-dependent DNA ligase
VTRVGTGFSVEEREYLNAQRSNLIGRACEVEGQPPLTDDGKIRFPRFTRWREDWDVSPEVKSLIEANSK